MGACLSDLLSLGRGALSDQWQVLCCMRRDPRLITAVCFFWVERVGSGLGAPVVPYFSLALGLSAPDIGLLSTVSLVCLILPAPLYGWIQDRHGPLYTIMVSSAACAIGCGLRGFAQNFWWLLPSAALAGFGGGNLGSTISAHVATETPPARRALCLSALAVQGAVLRTCGQALYVPWDAGLRVCGLADRLLRFRLTLSVCTFFCIFGVVQLCLNGRHLAPSHLRRAAARPGATAEAEGDASDTERRPGAETEPGGTAELAVLVAGRASPPSPTAPTPSQPSPAAPPPARRLLLLCGLALFLRAAADSLATLLWPLFLREHFVFAAREYSALLILATLCSTLAVATFPRMQRRAGDAATVALLGGGAAVALLAAFVVQTDSGVAQAAHACLMLCAAAGLAALEPCLRALASTLVPRSLQGRAFAALNVASALGSAATGVIGTRLYQTSLDSAGLPWAVRGGALPAVLLAPCLLAAVLLVRGAAIAHRTAGFVEIAGSGGTSI